MPSSIHQPSYWVRYPLLQQFYQATYWKGAYNKIVASLKNPTKHVPWNEPMFGASESEVFDHHTLIRRWCEKAGYQGRFILGGEGSHFYFSAEAVKLFEDQEGYFVAPGFGGVIGSENFFVDLGIDRPFRGDAAGSLVDEDSWRTRARLGIRF